ncbi:PEP-CTERM sorting domain-containing protein [Singulisphaera acidiphila]|uniref:Ice-binding protein C-terminal domain-containing protein n=1 Tax=Singulisphaera acidiphila (strain ATCC BAA-1392 / DSM 18658 / VKM B-2454 / MOB10) TaxID=886293 RepID=L0DPX5_SINAD|nr:PEP-CTERM sorting domain-containing protein [Singulisphaera acidiphila]AGA30888.1 hypothetical protein Sinac_6824 [Singulisphaera acidiphila DSM 18658]
MMTRIPRQLKLAIVALGLTAAAAGQARAGLVLETATAGTPATYGYSLFSNQTIGSRFHLDTTTAITQIGGNLGGSGTLFGAITALSAPDALPTGTSLTFPVLAWTVFTLSNDLTTDIFANLSVTLGPGDYALIFGTGRFGADGTGYLSFDNDDTPQSSVFFSNDTTGEYNDGGVTGVRLLVVGETPPVAVPEPSAMVSAATGVMMLGGFAWRRRRKAMTS